jgi:hypothetical protein
MHTQETIIQEIEYYGIVGYLDISFSKHLILITKQEEIDIQGLKIYKILETSEYLIYRGHVTTLDEDEFEQALLRDVKRDLRNSFHSLEYDLTNSLQDQKPLKKISNQDPTVFNDYLNASLDFALQTDQIEQKVKALLFISHEYLDFNSINPRYFWNRTFLAKLWEPKSHQFLVPLIKGHVNTTFETNMFLPPPLRGSSRLNIILISRLASFRTGTRYWTRGVDLSGNVAMEVETEMILFVRENAISYRTIRGSVPVIWNQRELNLTNPRINFDRALSDVSLDAGKVHIKRLIEKYGNVTILDLVGDPELDRLELATVYKHLKSNLKCDNVDYFQLKYHSLNQMEKYFKSNFDGELRKQHYFHMTDHETISHQRGIFRTSCVDCVDETTYAQYWLFEKKLKQMLTDFSLPKIDSGNLSMFQTMWIGMSNDLGYYYVGTAIENRYAIQKSVYNYLFCNFDDFYIHLSRFYLSRFQDYAKQDRLDLVAGVHPKGYDNVESLIMLRRQIIFSEFCHGFFLSFLLLVRRFLAPRDIRSNVQFVFAMIWAAIYMFTIKVFKVNVNVLLKKPKKLMDFNHLPIIDGPRKPHERGVVYNVERIHKEFLNSSSSINRRPLPIYPVKNDS